jgi:FtsH-binding integral membrane protein
MTGAAAPALQPTATGPTGKLGRMSTRTPGGDVPIRRIDRILTFMALGLVVLSVASLVAVLLAPTLGVTDYDVGIWPVAIILPLLALPIGFILIVVVLIMSFVRRARANRGG